MAFTEDLTLFFKTADFGVAATFNGSTTVNGIFDNEYAPAFDDEEGVQTSLPRFTCATSDVADAVGKTLQVSSTQYTIVEEQPDGTGVTVLVLAHPTAVAGGSLLLEGGGALQLEGGGNLLLEDG